MSRMLDCLVSYFGLVDGEDGVPLRYFAYQIVAGPGPAEKWGVAIISTLAVYDEIEPQRKSYGIERQQIVHRKRLVGPGFRSRDTLSYHVGRTRVT